MDFNFSGAWRLGPCTRKGGKIQARQPEVKREPLENSCPSLKFPRYVIRCRSIDKQAESRQVTLTARDDDIRLPPQAGLVQLKTAVPPTHQTIDEFE